MSRALLSAYKERRHTVCSQSRLMRLACAAVILSIFSLQGCNMNTAQPGFSKPSNTSPSSTPTISPEPGVRAVTNFATLMKKFPQGRPTNSPWVGFWWPYSSGGIHDSAGLYEKATGKIGAVSWESANHGEKTPGLQDWWGHCNGWAAAAALFPEPIAPRVVDGIEFGIADQKALLSEIAMDVDADFFGTRNDDDDPSSPSFQDVFPDQFFLVVTNYVGNGLSVLLDRYTGSQVWNQPIAAYAHSPITPANVLLPDPSAPGVTRVNMTTQIWWARDDVQTGAVTGQFLYKDDDSFQSRVYHYELWLDGPVKFARDGQMLSSGNVILAKNGQTVTGGAWKGMSDDVMDSHPDYLWAPHRVGEAKNYSNPAIDATWVIANFGY